MISFSLFFFGSLALLIYSFSLVVYRLFFHPLRGFPGPKLAAATKWYEFYFDICKRPGGTFIFELNRIHDVYGPIVRITPDEIHVKDSSWMEKLYAGPKDGARDKYPPAAHMLGTPQGLFGTISHNVHRKRRAVVSPFFSKASVTAGESMIYDKVQKLETRLSQDFARTGFAEMRMNYLALATDTLCEYAFGESPGLLDEFQSAANWISTIKAVAAITPVVKQFLWIMPLTLMLPLRSLEFLAPNLARIAAFRNDMNRQAQVAIDNRTNAREDEKDKAANTRRQNIFQAILRSPSLPEPEKTRSRMAEEGFVLLAAGGETTSRVLTHATFHLLQNREKSLVRLQKELQTAFKDQNDKPDVHQLEQLPWLTAVVKESLRITAVLTSRLPLVSPTEALIYQNWAIPPGTPVSMSLRDILLDPSTFPSPHSFLPERWLCESETAGQIQTNTGTLPFGRGSRMCVGMNLALAELYITLAYLFRRWDLEMYETTRERDVDFVRDCFVGETEPGSKGVRVTLRKP